MPAVGWLWPSDDDDDDDDIGGCEEEDGDDADDADDADADLECYIICAPSFDVQPAWQQTAQL